MVRVPGSLGDAGFHRESQNDAQMSNGSGDETPTETGSPTVSLNMRSTDRPSPGRSSAHGTEADLATDLEEKPCFPPKAPSGTPADPDASQDPPEEDPLVKTRRSSSTTLASLGAASKKTKAARKKLKAPDAESEDQTILTWSQSKLEMAYPHAELNNFLREDPVMRTMHLKLLGFLTGPVQAPLSTKNKLDAAMDLLRLLKEAGITAGAFDADDLFHLEVDEIRVATAALFNLLKPMVGERPAARRPKPFSLLKPLDDEQPAVKPAEPKNAQAQSPKYHTGSSQYASATSKAGSDSSSGSRRMSLGPSGAAMLQARAAGDLSVKIPTPRPAKVTSSRVSPRTPPQDPANSLETYFQAAMSRFLSERPEMRTPRQRAIHSKI
ncbi:hypothetical protein PF005_g10715 [Phytophthora fragariae]|uniref:Uncharacterized protein n=2 Tax=Phytophthora fragariae TaxID=53985 RepID=A0A6A4BMU7_9STRA|nr:hypothetical protein PF003_g7879 [Phytophthora fragariae]KAE8938500.1 hypothetical protein PF009_g11610 [Phytophthora fragariae]KAE8970306.1 hypothetical protein PF011_g26471 [Phytophthora fragariae]KAE9068617.1 hypothetical protein PF010_g26993 [Phytophthora fragariae]KAE9069198.1 hypothetical protein PF007_g27409 [Phytophthora fragariae]